MENPPEIHAPQGAKIRPFPCSMRNRILKIDRH